MSKFPVMYLFGHDFGVTRLTDRFVAEAKAKWPGKSKELRFDWSTGRTRRVVVARWEVEARDGIDRLVLAAWAAGGELTHLSTVRALDAP